MLGLIWLFLIPALSSVVLFLCNSLSNRQSKILACILSLIPLFMLIVGNKNWIGVNLDYLWIPALNIHFHLSIDHLSFLFLFLTVFIVPISILAVRSHRIPFTNSFYGLVLLLEALLIGFFTAKDLVVFTLFWEAILIPLYFIITFWGGQEGRKAALKFLIYMIAGSFLMVAAVLGLYFAAGSSETFDMQQLSKTAESSPYAKWILGFFLLAFAVKTPLFPFHAWLPDAYYQAPMGGTILLSAILSKAGIYGIVRIALGFFPTLMVEWGPLLLALAVTGVFYGGFAAWMQTDYKRLLAYSSLSHINFVLAGLFAWNEIAHGGAILQALNHGITIAALFLAAGWLEERLGTTSMNNASGLAKFFPILCWTTLFFVLSSVALPGTNNFIGEFLILLGLFNVKPFLAAFLGLTIILSVIYMLRWMQKMYFETPIPFLSGLGDIKMRELLLALPLAALILWIGMYPSPILNQIEPVQEISTTSEAQ